MVSLNYILPEVFTSSLGFDEAAKIYDDSLNRSFISKARALLEDHMMLRRIKADVERSLLPKIQCKITLGLTALQLKWYKSFITRHTDDSDYLRLLTLAQVQNILSQLRKIVNHPKQLYYKRLELRKKEKSRIEELKFSGSEFAKGNESLLDPLEKQPRMDFRK